MPSDSQAVATPETQAKQFHWVMTVQTSDGRQATNDGRINAIPGVHTQEATYQAVRNAMKDLVETDHFTIVFFALHPNQL